MFLKSHLLLFIFQMFVEVSLSLKFFLSYLFVLNIYVYICVMCMYIYVCVCIYTHLHTHFIYHHLNGILIYQHTSAAPVFNLGFLKKFLKLFLMKNIRMLSESLTDRLLMKFLKEFHSLPVICLISDSTRFFM